MKGFFYRVSFYKCPATGTEPARKWLKKLTAGEREVIGKDLMVVQYNWPIGMPRIRSMKNGLWELRSILYKKEARLFFVVHKKYFLVLHGFIKKTQKTPRNELKIALERLKNHTFDKE